MPTKRPIRKPPKCAKLSTSDTEVKHNVWVRVVLELTWDESDGNTNDQVNGQEDKLKYRQLILSGRATEILTLLTGR